jgi:serpin B
MIAVNRNGSKAAAVTVVGLGDNSCRPGIILNRPFLYGIVDNDTGVPLFLGAVTDMSELN